MTRFREGVSLPRRGLKFLKEHPSLWPWILIPWLIDLTVLIVGWIQGWIFIQTSTAAMLASWLGGGWLFSVLYYPAVAIFGLAFVILWIVVVVSVATLIAAPFTTILVEKALQRQGVATVNSGSIALWLKHSWQMLKTTMVKAVLFGVADEVLHKGLGQIHVSH